MSKVIHIPFNAHREINVTINRTVQPRVLQIPSYSLTELTSGPIDVRLIDIEQTDGNTTIAEQIVISALAKFYTVQKVFEFGTFDGKTSANLALNLGPTAEILTIDLPANEVNSTANRIERAEVKFVKKERSGEKFQTMPNVTQLYGDTARFDFAPWYGTRDMVFVDASHEYKYVKNDTEIALNLLKSRGLLVWHDYSSWAGVAKALNEYHQADRRFRGLKRVSGTSVCFMLKEDASP